MEKAAVSIGTRPIFGPGMLTAPGSHIFLTSVYFTKKKYAKWFVGWMANELKKEKLITSKKLSEALVLPECPFSSFGELVYPNYLEFQPEYHAIFKGKLYCADLPIGYEAAVQYKPLISFDTKTMSNSLLDLFKNLHSLKPEEGSDHGMD